MNDKVYLPPIPDQDLPPLPSEEDEVNLNIDNDEASNFNIEDQSVELENLNEETHARDELLGDFKSIARNNSQESKPIFIVSLFIALITLGFAISIFINTQKSAAITNVSQATKLSLMSYINSPVDQGLKVKIKKINSSPTFWIVSNYRLDAKVVMTLRSKKNRILGLDKVYIESEGSFEAGTAYISKSVLKDGLSITPGEYEYTVSFYPKGRKFRINNIFKKFLNLSFYEEEMAQSSFKGDVIFYNKGEREFEKKIKQYYMAIDKKIRDPLKEQLSRYKTFNGLLERTFSHYTSKIDSFKKGSDVSKFEKLYNKDVGPFLRDLMIDANRIHIAHLNIDPQKSKIYEEIFNIGVRIGEMASDMVTDTIKHSKLDNKSRGALKKKFAKIFTEIQIDISSKTSNIKLELAKYED